MEGGGAMKYLLWSVAAGVALWAATRLLEPGLTWFPLREITADPAAYGMRFENVEVASFDGVLLRGWYCPPRPGVDHRADLLFLNGNAGNVSHRLAKIRPLTGLGLGVFIVDYRGFGRSGGKPGDAGVLRDAGAAWSAARRRAAASGVPIGIYGESIGGLPALRLAAADPAPAFLVLEGSFPGKRAVAARTPPFWPFLPFLSRALESGAHAARVRSPALVMHARADEVIPLALGRRVHGRLGASRLREWYEVPRGGHNDCFEADAGFFPRIGEFLERALPSRIPG